MGQQYGRVAVISVLLMLSSVVAGETAQVVDAGQAEQRGFDALKVDEAQAIQWFEQAAAAGRPAAQWALGTHYFDGQGVDKNVPRAVELMRAAAVQSFAPAQSFLAWMYFDGVGVERDLKQAFDWFSAAARQEDAYALRMLAGFYFDGIETKRDTELAKRLIVRAAQLGNQDAALSAYGLMLYGPAETRDPSLAIHYLTKAAKANDTRATFMLAREYLRGASVKHDPVAAVQWLQRSAEAGNVLASLWLSELHFKGFGVTRDSTRGEKLLSEALARASMQDRNQFAWDLSVSEDERLRDGTLAIRVLESALAAAAEKQTAHVDTLAAAYAEVRQFDRAVLTQQSAIERAKRDRSPQEMIAGMVERLRLYESGKPYREIAR